MSQTDEARNIELNTNEEQKESGTVPEFTDAQLIRKIKCKTVEKEIVEAPWLLLMQSKTFKKFWELMKMEETFEKQKGSENEFIFPLNEISGICFGKIVEWMEEHKGQPEVEVKMDKYNATKEWFELTAFEKDFFDVDFETLKEYFMAANFLELKSLFIYSAQEAARAIMDKDAEEVREMLCIPEEVSQEDLDLINHVLENCHLIDFDKPEEENKKEKPGSNSQ